MISRKAALRLAFGGSQRQIDGRDANDQSWRMRDAEFDAAVLNGKLSPGLFDRVLT